MKKIIINGKYKHYKGNVYLVLCLGKHSETLEDLVIYKDVEKELVWARPINMFLDEIILDNKKINRFEYIGD